MYQAVMRSGSVIEVKTQKEADLLEAADKVLALMEQEDYGSPEYRQLAGKRAKLLNEVWSPGGKVD